MYNWMVLLLWGVAFVPVHPVTGMHTAAEGTEKGNMEKGPVLQPVELFQADSTDWRAIRSVEEVWRAYPDRVRFLMEQLDLDKAGLEKVRVAVQKGDTVEAAKALIAYYKESNSGFWLRDMAFESIAGTDIREANNLLENRVSFSGEDVALPVADNGGWPWYYKGPEKDSEFAYSLNGHQYIISLLKAWQKTNREEYVKKFDRLLRNWIIHNPLPSEQDSMYMVLNTSTETLDWRDITEVRWRDIEAGQRMGATWPQTFYGFQQSGAFLPATRLLMLWSIAEHAAYLRAYHKEGHNWTTMEMNGLSLVGLAFPEFQQAEAWSRYALEVMQKEINNQVYPDGTQTELSTKTQWVALKRFESLADNFGQAGQAVPGSYVERLEQMYRYLAYSMRPDGHQPLNNDSDREDLRPRVLEAAGTYGRPDWRWIATNGREGQPPGGVPSAVFPWAGIHVMRDGWGPQAQWGFFDTGPFGTGHQHSDKLHLSVSAYGRDLLVDGGRYTHENYFSFDPTTWRGYFRSSFSHNVILVDGGGQTSESNRAEAALVSGDDYLNRPGFDYARGTYGGAYAGAAGGAAHTRAVLYVRGRYWVVVDRIATDRPREIQALWHYAPGLPLQSEGHRQVVSTSPGGANLRITPAGPGAMEWTLEVVEGQTEPVIQGWYSETYGRKTPNPTAVYRAEIDGDVVFGWVLTPAGGEVPPVRATLLEATPRQARIRVEVEGEPPVTATVPLQEGLSPLVETE
ncbi:Heparinase II/III-like protein [Fodinibius roseus]|uniref:Heparinase II/III-like protein n=1 Tax=Fodinibius roseus TaxID=1194090 RepID=A0A1M5DUP4_9BACT|nr:alginate lyase family protein [Fodinibius roseus]SHF70717.1 Heparinase II/III-like protein [Fodinibius roseus]